jgi:hypothetical protein
MSDCIIDPRVRDKDGYAVASYGGKQSRAHRVAWLKAHGEIPKGLSVLHSCDNPACVNLGHLRLGTHKDNMDERTRKGRHSYGEKSNSTHLTEDDVRCLRKVHAAGVMGLKDVGALFGVSKCGAWNIVHRRTWAHVY